MNLLNQQKTISVCLLGFFLFFFFLILFLLFFLGGLVFCPASEVKRLTEGQVSTRAATKQVAEECNQKEGMGKGQGNGTTAGIR